jgi:hypothetical protein|tara:strand:- start:153 stop:416 length:264 start_codon:yes stop_codon:yes gene_type:complete
VWQLPVQLSQTGWSQNWQTSEGFFSLHPQQVFGSSVDGIFFLYIVEGANDQISQIQVFRSPQICADARGVWKNQGKKYPELTFPNGK